MRHTQDYRDRRMYDVPKLEATMTEPKPGLPRRVLAAQRKIDEVCKICTEGLQRNGQRSGIVIALVLSLTGLQKLEETWHKS
jgi:hypothetical protein